MHVIIILQNGKVLLKYLGHMRCDKHIKIKVKGPRSKGTGLKKRGERTTPERQSTYHSRRLASIPLAEEVSEEFKD